MNQDNSSHVYLDTMLQNIGSPAKCSTLSGKLYAAASIELTIPNPVGPNITLFSYELAHQTLLDLRSAAARERDEATGGDRRHQRAHAASSRPGPDVHGRAVTVQPFHNMYGTDRRPDRRGRRNSRRLRGRDRSVHRAEERLHDATTTTWSASAGAAPDGVSIHIIDPFRVFADEGAADPEPAQTTPGVVLAGGKNVNYRLLGSGRRLAREGVARRRLRLQHAHRRHDGVRQFHSRRSPGSGQATLRRCRRASMPPASALINSQIDAAVAPADPAGIIGSTMSASHGGLMLGGPGNNSFFAAGPAPTK